MTTCRKKLSSSNKDDFTPLELDLEDESKHHKLLEKEKPKYHVMRDESPLTLFFSRSEKQQLKLAKKRLKELDKIESRAAYEHHEARSEKNQFKLYMNIDPVQTKQTRDAEEKPKRRNNVIKL